MLKLTPENLESEGYLLLDKLEHKDLLPFVRKYLYQYSLWPIIYFAINIILLALMGGLIGKSIASQQMETSKALGYTGLGFAFVFLLIPLHEYIHAVAYRICGAKEVTFDADFKKMVFMAMAHRFVTSSRELIFIALAPISFISMAILLFIPFTSGYQIYAALGLLLTHSAFCGGDFAMLSYSYSHKDKTVVTWDDKVNKVSYFYGKSKGSL